MGGYGPLWDPKLLPPLAPSDLGAIAHPTVASSSQFHYPLFAPLNLLVTLTFSLNIP